MGIIVTRNRIYERALQQAHINPIYQPEPQASDVLAGISIALFIMAGLFWAAAAAGEMVK
jgi:hypothetical protein